MQGLERQSRLIGRENCEKISKLSVAVFGIGGVGGFTAEALARCGVGKITLIDSDVVESSNVNRQIVALTNTIGKYKTQVMKERILSINPQCLVDTYELFYLPETSDKIDLSEYDYIVDAIDTVSAKIHLVQRANNLGVKIISCMGTGKKTDISALRVDDIYNTSVCPLARVMRRELKKRDIKSLKVVYSTQEPIENDPFDNDKSPSSMIFVPATAGLMLANYVIQDAIKE